MKRSQVIRTIQARLLKRREALRRMLGADLRLAEYTERQVVGDAVDAAIESTQDEINSQLIEAESRELVAIENALERLREGQFGVCEDCQRAIPAARLQAVPYATLCVDCQRELERGRGGERPHSDWSRVVDINHDDRGTNSAELQSL